jgi:hypothetical protein
LHRLTPDVVLDSRASLQQYVYSQIEKRTTVEIGMCPIPFFWPIELTALPV